MPASPPGRMFQPFVLASSVCLLVGACQSREADRGAGSTPAARADAPLREPDFRVATFNMNWGNVDLADTVRVVASANADLVLMQETNPESERAIREGLAGAFPHMRFTQGVRYSSGFAILSRAPLSDVRFLEPEFGFFGTLLASVELRGRKVRVASVHLEPIVPREGGRTADLLALFLETEGVHLNEIRRIFAELRDIRPIIVGGDLNSASFGSAPRFLKERGLVDSFAAVTPGADAHITWRWNHQGTDWRFRIDYIFHSPEIRTIESGIIDAPSSDHSLVVSRLAWRESGDR